MICTDYFFIDLEDGSRQIMRIAEPDSKIKAKIIADKTYDYGPTDSRAVRFAILDAWKNISGVINTVEFADHHPNPRLYCSTETHLSSLFCLMNATEKALESICRYGDLPVIVDSNIFRADAEKISESIYGKWAVVCKDGIFCLAVENETDAMAVRLAL